MQDCDVGLLIGYNCPMALAPRNCVTGRENDPFAVQTSLGWSIVGGVDQSVDGDAIGSSFRILVKNIQEEMRPRTGRDAHRIDVRFVAKTNVKEVMDIPPTEIIRILEDDFGDDPKGEHLMSQDDMLFLEKVGNGIHQATDGHYSMPLPFRVRPSLPNNRDVVLRRYNHLKRRFKQNEGYLHDYQKFMDEILERGDAEKIPTEELEDETAWYIPHHGIYHSNKPGKIRVVFDHSAKYQGTALNDHLLQGPDLTNGLIGVLARFRKEPIAIMCDIEKMFHQFRVDKRDRDYLRFQWNDEDYRMKVHLFGATSSPGCANYAFKQVAKSSIDGVKVPPQIRHVKI